MKVRDAQKLRTILLAIGSITMLAAYPNVPMFIIGAMIAFSCLIPHFLYNKCPHCGNQLGIKMDEICWHCGLKID